MRESIAFSHYSVKDDISGVTTWLQRLLTRLEGDGVPVSLLLHHRGDDIADSAIVAPLRDAGVAVEIVTSPSYTEPAVVSTLEFLNRHQPRAFFPQCMEPMYLAAWYAGPLGLPWALTVHSDDPVYWAAADMVDPPRRNGSIVAVSEFIRTEADSRGLSDRARTIPCGVPLSVEHAEYAATPFRVAFSGRVVEQQKRFSLVLESMAAACRRDPAIECVVLGDGPDLSSAMAWVSAHDLSDRIRFTGRLQPAEVHARLAECQAILMMSDFEGLPVALMEAMAIGVVPIARSIHSGIPELVHHDSTGLLVDENPDNAATALIELAHNPDAWHRYSTAARRRVESHYSEDACYRQWVELIGEMCQRSSIAYPIEVPRKLSLPPAQPALAERDRRTPPLHRRATGLARRGAHKAKRFVDP